MPEFPRHPFDLALDAGAEMVDGGGQARMQPQLIQLGLLAVALEFELFVGEVGVVGETSGLDQQGLAALGPREVPRMRAHG